MKNLYQNNKLSVRLEGGKQQVHHPAALINGSKLKEKTNKQNKAKEKKIRQVRDFESSYVLLESLMDVIPFDLEMND